MSNYDPFRLYDYKQKKSHKGQVLRKKFVGNPLPTVLTPEQLKEAKEILEGIGYTVTKNPIIPPTPPETQYRSYIYCDKIDSYTFNAGDHIMYLSDVWSDKISDFQDLFVPSDRVNSFTFEINVISYQLNGTFYSSTSSKVQHLLFNDATGSTDYSIMTYNGTRTGGYHFFASDSNTVYLSGGLNADTNTYDQSSDSYRTRSYYWPFLYHHYDNTIDSYNAIVSSDFTNYNPILMNIGVTGSWPVTVTNLMVTYQITMTINANI